MVIFTQRNCKNTEIYVSLSWVFKRNSSTQKQRPYFSFRLDSFFVCLFRFEFPKLEMFALVLPFLSQETIKARIKYILKP